MSLHYRVFIILILSVLLVPCVSVDAAEIIFQPDGASGKDGWVDSSSGTAVHGSEDYFYFGGNCSGGELRLYIQFDLSTLTSSSAVDLAQLELYMFSQNGYMDYNYSIFRITEAWNEATLTWNTQPACESPAAVTFPGTEWQAAYGEWHAITGLASLVQYWIGNPDQNHGMVIQPTSSFYGAPIIWSSDYSGASLRPRLVINGELVGTGSSTWGGVKQLSVEAE